MPDSTLQLAGECYCGGVQFSVEIADGQEPLFSVYCHCESCRRAHAAPLYHVVCVDTTMLQVTAGSELLQAYARPEHHLTRSFCNTCGTRMFNRFGDWKPDGKTPIAFFPNTLRAEHNNPLPEALKAKRHNRLEECVLDKPMLRTALEA